MQVPLEYEEWDELEKIMSSHHLVRLQLLFGADRRGHHQDELSRKSSGS